MTDDPAMMPSTEHPILVTNAMKDLAIYMMIASGILLIIVARWLSNFDLERTPVANDLQLLCGVLGILDFFGGILLYFVCKRRD